MTTELLTPPQEADSAEDEKFPVYRGPDLTDGDAPKSRRILSVVPIVLVLAAWVAIFCVYGRQIMSVAAPFTR